MFATCPFASHNSLKIIVWKMLLNTFLMSTYITTQLGCRLRKAQMRKGMSSQPLRVDTPNWWGDRCFWNNLQSCKTMEWLISWKNTSLTIIGQRPLVFFDIANNLLTPDIEATDLGISSHAIITITLNNSKNPKDGSFSMEHPNRCSYTIPNIPLEDKWGIMVKAWVNKVLSRTKVCIG